MSFSFGSPAPAPSSGFSFGSPAPAPTTGFSFGSTSSSSSVFGSTSAPSFGSTPAPAPTGFSFGAPSTAQAPSGGGFSFGSPSTAPATSTSGFSFGASAPAPGSGGFSFGGTSPAPAFGSSATAPSAFTFGGLAPAPLFSPTSASGFSSQVPGAFGAGAQQQQPGVPPVAYSTPYGALPEQYRKAIDDLHTSIVNHKRTMMQVKSMAPNLLVPLSAGSTACELSSKIEQLLKRVENISGECENIESVADQWRKVVEESATEGYIFGQWPLEALQVRRGVRLIQEEKKETNLDAEARIRELLSSQVAFVDRVERMPSPYYWGLLKSMLKRLETMQQRIVTLEQQMKSFQQTMGTGSVSVRDMVELQHQALWRIMSKIGRVRDEVEEIRLQYRLCETDENVLEREKYGMLERERRLDESIRSQYVQAGSAGAPTTSQSPAPSAFSSGGSSTPGAFSLSSSTPAPPTGTSAFSFGSTSSSAAPASGTSSFSFGGSSSSNAAPAFGSGTSITSGLGGSSTSTIPASNTSSSKKKGSSSRATGRIRR